MESKGLGQYCGVEEVGKKASGRFVGTLHAHTPLQPTLKMKVFTLTALLGFAGLSDAQVPNRPPTYMMNRLVIRNQMKE